METNQITTTKGSSITIPEMWAGDNLGENKPAYPNLLLMQPSSNLVAQGVANAGDIVDGSSKEVILKKGTPIEFFPIMLNSEWHRYKKNNPQDKDKWMKCEKLAMPPHGAGTKWTTEERLDGGYPTKEGRLLRVFIGIVGKLDLYPYMIVLKGMSTGAAIALLNHAERKVAQKKPYADTVFKMVTGPKEFGGKTQQAIDILPSRSAKPEELKIAIEWRQSLLTMRDKVLAQEEDDSGAAF